jgi:hypothetical protein
MQSKNSLGKNYFVVFCIFFQFYVCNAASAHLQNFKGTDYNSLATNPATDHVAVLAELFQFTPNPSVLEFGMNYATPYLLDHCDHVTSCEIILSDDRSKWCSHIVDCIGKRPNWSYHLLPGSTHFEVANKRAYRKRVDPALYDSTYILEIKDICDTLFKAKEFDVVIVNPGFHMRADLVNELFDRAPIIVAHDTNTGFKEYSWWKIEVPSNYETVVFKEGQGTTVWIRNDRADLVSLLKMGEISNKSASKKLRIFFPQVHPILVESVATALKHLGHTLLLPGKSFSKDSPVAGPKISYGTCFDKDPFKTLSFTRFFSENPIYCKFLNDVEVVENDEILSNPPDVLVVNCPAVENDIYSMLYQIQTTNKGTKTKIVHHSGNNGTHYNPAYVKNLISTDAYTAHMYDLSKVNTIFWVPWIDFKGLSYEEESDNLQINTYINHYYYYYMNAFPKSRAIFEEVQLQFLRDFPQLRIGLYPKSVTPKEYQFTPHEEVIQAINHSFATLHIKESEGMGYSILESLAKGRPVFLKRSFSLGSRLMHWCIEGKTAFFFDDYPELFRKMKKYSEDESYRHAVQKECAVTVRRIINNEKQARVLEKFLQNLK